MIADFGSIIIYWFGLLLTLLLTVIYSRMQFRKKYWDIVWIALICLPLSIIAGMRSYVGTDYVNYVRIFNEVKYLTLGECFTHSYLDRGFAVLVKLIWYITDNLKVIFFLFNFATLFIALKAVSKYKKDMSVMLFMLLFYLIIYHHSLNILRQCFAVSLMIWALCLMIERKVWKSLIVCVLAMFIHNTMIIGILFIVVLSILCSEKEMKKLENGTCSSVHVLYYCLIFISIFLVPFFLKLMIKMPVFQAYAKYFIADVDIGIGRIAEFIILFAPLLWVWKTIVSSKALFAMFNAAVLYLPVAFTGYYFNWASRMNLYTTVIFAIMIPMIFKKEKNPNKKFVIVCWYLFYFVGTYFLEILIKNYGETFPYII